MHFPLEPRLQLLYLARYSASPMSQPSQGITPPKRGSLQFEIPRNPTFGGGKSEFINLQMSANPCNGVNYLCTRPALQYPTGLGKAEDLNSFKKASHPASSAPFFFPAPRIIRSSPFSANLAVITAEAVPGFYDAIDQPTCRQTTMIATRNTSRAFVMMRGWPSAEQVSSL